MVQAFPDPYGFNDLPLSTDREFLSDIPSRQVRRVRNKGYFAVSHGYLAYNWYIVGYFIPPKFFFLPFFFICLEKVRGPFDYLRFTRNRGEPLLDIFG